jgi:hypothetical protein
LYLAVYYLDKYLWKYPQRDASKIDVVADACLFIAMKYEEIYPPMLAQWAGGRENSIFAM